ncbi:hypothetical protein CL654_03290 [bacterium]|mgnify:CR=1 FL=1|nr:hypothetical protein [bacterium]|tara:strand:- start:4625 stop:5242 length:618 start_codon:yes stop_codon:yes gene_type:complete
MNTKTEKQLYKKGLSIIETVVAILIISFVIGAPIGVLQQGLFLSQNAKERVTARFLAEEPLEYLRNLKDSNIVQSVKNVQGGGSPISFSQGLLMACVEGSGNNCLVDVHRDIFTGCSVTSLCQVRFADSSECDTSDMAGCERIYGHETIIGGNVYEETSEFSRKITVESVSSDEFRVRVSTGWDTPQTSFNSVAVEEYFRSFGFD